MSEPIPTETSESDTVNNKEVMARLVAYNSEKCSSELTDAQLAVIVEKHRQFLANREVQLTGIIDDVREIMGKYDAIVSLDKVDMNILVDKLTKEQALSLNKGDHVLLTGTLEIPGCYIYVQLHGTLTIR